MREQYRLQIQTVATNYESTFIEFINKMLLEIEDSNPKIIYQTARGYNYSAVIEYRVSLNRKEE
jgi:hypothetical protein